MMLMAFSLSGCSSLYYFYQAGKGQWSLMNRGKPIEKVIDDPTTHPELAKLLKNIPSIRQFCEDSGLKPTSNYREYVKLDRDAVVYVVTVSDPLQFKVRIFSFPIAGSFNYIGWFSEKDAKEFAKQFEDQGLDVDIRGASAYSTLGWFKDPLLSTMIPIEDGKIEPRALVSLVNVLIHESVHATLYLKNQSYFNESLASFIADQLTADYFKSRGMVDSPEWKDYLKVEAKWKSTRQRMVQAYADLKTIYESSLPESHKNESKKGYLEKLQKDLNFKRPINNATLVQFKTYDEGDHGFGRLYERSGRNVIRFLRSLEAVGDSRFKKDQDEDFDVSNWPVLDDRLTRD